MPHTDTSSIPPSKDAGKKLPENAGMILLALARNAIAAQLGMESAKQSQQIDPDWLRQPGASFVTLTHQGKLRGCIGTLEARQPLVNDVTYNAIAAARRDPRFVPVSAQEYPGIDVEVSVLSPMLRMTWHDENDAMAQLRPGIDGVVFEYGHHKSTFLPQVWNDLREPATFLRELKYKAGLPPDFWRPEVKLSRYTVTKWQEPRAMSHASSSSPSTSQPEAGAAGALPRRGDEG